MMLLTGQASESDRWHVVCNGIVSHPVQWPALAGHAGKEVVMRRLVCVLLMWSVIRSALAQSVVPLELGFIAEPRTLDQVEHLQFNLPPGWDKAQLGVFYTTRDVSSCTDPRACLNQFDGQVSVANVRGRVPYRAHRGLLSGGTSAATPIFMFAAALLPKTGQLAISPLSRIVPQDVVGSSLPKPGAFDNQFQYLPPPDRRTEGDVYVDAVQGLDDNDGRTPTRAVRTIPAALQRLHEAFPSAAARAGKVILVKRGTYYSEAGNGVISLPDNPYLYTERDSEGHRLVGAPGNPVKILADPSAQGEVHLVARRRSDNCPVLIGVELSGTADLIVEGFHLTWNPSEPVSIACGLATPIELINPDESRGIQIRYNKINTHRAKWGTQLFGNCSNFAFIGNESYGLTGEHQLYLACGPYWDNGKHVVQTPGTKHNFLIIGNTFFGSERWGTQINGNMQDIYVARNRYISNGTGAVKSEGASGVTIIGNEMYGVSTCVSVENYLNDTYFNRAVGDFSGNRGDLAAFRKALQLVNGYITIANNSCYVPDTNLYDEPIRRSGSDPAAMPAITIAEDFKFDTSGRAIGEPHHDIVVANNVVSTASSGVFRYMVSVADTQRPNEEARLERQLESAKVYNNIFFTRSGLPAEVYATHWHPTQGNVVLDRRGVGSMEARYSDLWIGNVVGVDPEFTELALRTGLTDAQMLALFTAIDQRGAGIPLSDLTPSATSVAVDAAIPVVFASGAVGDIREDARRGRRTVVGTAPDLGAIESPYTRSSFLGGAAKKRRTLKAPSTLLPATRLVSAMKRQFRLEQRRARLLPQHR